MSPVDSAVLAALKGEPAPPAPAPQPEPPAEPPVDAAPPADPPAEPTPPPEPSETDAAKWSSKFSALSRQERELRAQRDKFKADRDAFKGDQAKATEYAQQLEAFKADPVAFMEWMGSQTDIADPYDHLTQAKLNGGTPGASHEVSELKKRVDAFEAASDKAKKDAEEVSAQKGQQEHVDNFKSSIAAHIEANLEDSELCHAFGQTEYVYSLVDAHYSETGKVLPVGEAVALAERNSTEQWRGLVEKLLTAPKAKAALLEMLAAANEPVPQPSKQGTPKTLTNRQASAPPPRTDPARKLTREESIEKGARILRGEKP